MRDAENYLSMKDWYSRHTALAKEIFGEHEPLFEKFAAAASAGLTGKPNVDEAVRAMEHFLTGGRFDDGSYHPAGLYAQSTLSNYINIQNNEDLSGRKVPHFFQNLTGNLDEVTGDRHMGRLIFENFKSTLTDSQEAVMQEVVSAWAEKLNWKPAELQAALWEVDFAHAAAAKGKTFDPSKVWDYQQVLQAQEPRLRALMETLHGPNAIVAEPEPAPGEHTTRVITDFKDRPLDIQVNPSEQDIRSMAKEGPVRVMFDKDKNIYAWDSDKAMHATVARGIGLSMKEEIAADRDIWQMIGGKLVSTQALQMEAANENKKEVADKAAQAVRDQLDWVKTGTRRLAKHIIKLWWH
jgi:hypothetical protein